MSIASIIQYFLTQGKISIDSLDKSVTDLIANGVNSSTLGLGNVNNTSDANKPISNAQALVNAKKVEYAVVTDYNTLKNLANPSALTIIKVTIDSDKQNTNTIYQLWPDGTRMYFAAIKDN